VTAVDFPTLVSEWQMANYLTAVPGFTEPTARLRYRSWNLRAAFTTKFGTYPLQPDSIGTPGTFSHSGVLHPGSGRHLLITQNGSGPGVAIAFTDGDSTVVSASIVPRFGLTRMR